MQVQFSQYNETTDTYRIGFYVENENDETLLDCLIEKQVIKKSERSDVDEYAFTTITREKNPRV